MNLVLLSGLDGTGVLRVLPSHFSPMVISYPPDEPLGYAELVTYGPHLLLQRKPEECLAAMNRFLVVFYDR